MKKLLFYVIAAVILFFLAYPKLKPLFEDTGSGASGGMASAGNAPLAVEVVELSFQPLIDRIYSSGSVDANERIDLRSEITGMIREIYLEEGTRVEEGDLLLKLNDSELQAQKERAQYRLNLAVQQEDRQRRLLEKGGISQEDYDATLNQVNIFRSELQLIGAQLEKTEIRAPFSGQIGLKYVSKGQFIGPDQPIASLQELDPVKIDFSVPERYVGRVDVGDDVRFEVQGIDSVFTGQVYAIEPRINMDTRTLSIRAISENPGSLLYPGAFATIELILETIEEALMVPTISIIPGLNTQKVYVLNREGSVEERVVTTGIRTSEKVQILRGLDAGDKVLQTGLLQVRPGMQVDATLIQGS